MLAEHLLLRLRSRLRDRDFANLKFNDNEILDIVEEVQNELIFLFNQNIQEIKLQVQGKSVPLPYRILNIIQAKAGNMEIPLKTLPQILRNEPKILCIYQKTPLEYALNLDYFGEITLWVNCAVSMQEPSEELFLDKIFANALIYGTLAQMFQIESHAQNLERASYYAQSYRQELQNVRNKINGLRERKNLTSKFVLV